MTTPLIGRIMACVPGYGTTVQRTTYNERGWAVGGGREKRKRKAEREREARISRTFLIWCFFRV